MARKSRKNPGTPDAAKASEGRALSKALFHAAIYVRLSVENSGKDDEGESIENQKNICEDFLNQHPEIKLFDVYEDNGRKGTNTDRPEFNRMMEDIRTGKVNCIIVKDLSRFSRDYIAAGRYLEKVFPFMGVRFVSVTDRYDSFDTTHNADGIMLPLKNMINTAYAKDISRKIITSFNARRERCELLPSAGPYGYVKSEKEEFRYEVDRKVGRFVTMIFEWIRDSVNISWDTISRRSFWNPNGITGRFMTCCSIRPIPAASCTVGCLRTCPGD